MTERVLLGDVMDIASGQVDPRVEPFCDQPHVGGDNIESGSGRLFGMKTARELNLISGKYEFGPGDVLYSKIRPALNKVALPDFNGICSADMYPLRPRRDRLDRRFLAYLLRHDDFLSFAEKHSSRTNIPKINREALVSYEFLLPRLPEQRRIAEILDNADAIRRKRKEAIALTEELLRSAFLEMFGDIPAKRSRWPFVPLREYLSAASGKSSKPVLSPNPTGIPVYGGNGINGWATRALYREPVVVVGRVGQQCGITRITDGPAWVTDNAIVITIERPDLLHPVYLAVALESSPLRASVMRLDLPFINQSTILDFPLPLPPIAEQQRFAALRQRALETSSTFRRALGDAEQLFASLVHRAFRGELTSSKRPPQQLGLLEDLAP